VCGYAHIWHPFQQHKERQNETPSHLNHITPHPIQTRIMNGPGRIPSARSSKEPGWFQGAPLSKCFCFSTIAFFLILKNGLTELIALDLQDLIEHKEFYRLVLYPLTFTTIGELIMGLAVFVPLSKRFEREFGSTKYAAFLIKSSCLATFMQRFFLSDQYLATGPYPMIGTLLYLYNAFTPRLHPKFVSILGFDFSEKALTHIFAIQLVFSQGYHSLVPFAAGYLSGFLSISKRTPYGKWDPTIPQPLYRLVHGIAKTIGLEDLAHSPSYISAQRNGRNGHGNANGIQRAGAMHSNNNPNANANDNVNRPPHVPGIPRNANTNDRGGDGGRDDPFVPQPPVEPQYEPMPVAEASPEAVEMLLAMGFERDAVVRALRDADNNVEHAANRLLMTGI